jgi:CrcB protein
VIDGRSLLAVALGGGLGSLLRYFVAFGITQRFGPGFPWGTLIINITGSFIIGAVAEFGQTRAFGVTPVVRVFLMIGVLGGYTTFSTFSYDLFTMAAGRSVLPAFAYAFGSVALGFAAAYAGVVAARALVTLH